MIQESCQCILLDIEGTTSSISFVYDVMFAYVRQHLARFLQENWLDPTTQAAVTQLIEDASMDGNAETFDSGEPSPCIARLEDHVLGLMDSDRKTTGLKQLQGLIWRTGFESGQLRAHLYEDVEPALRRWKRQAIDLRIYSSGSVQAQKLFFGHTESGDLLSLFTAHYDTKIGSKKESESYSRIAQDCGLHGSQILFISDVLAELQAAETAGMKVVASIRPGNAPLPAECKMKKIHSFAEISIA